jgi:hypothetical protein
MQLRLQERLLAHPREIFCRFHGVHEVPQKMLGANHTPKQSLEMLEMSDPPSMYLSEYYSKLVLLLDLIASLSSITSHFILLQGPILYTNILVAITCSNDDHDILHFWVEIRSEMFFS